MVVRKTPLGRPASLTWLSGCLALWTCGVSGTLLVARPTCPTGYYRKEPLLFGCGEQLSGAHMLMSGSRGANLEVPAGLEGLELKVVAPTGLGLSITLRDDSTGSEILQGDGNARSSSVVWMDARLLLLGGDSGRGDLQHVIFKCAETLPAALTVQVTMGPQASRTMSNVSFSCRNYQRCTEVPLGCVSYDSYAARAMIFNWSSWAQQHFSDAAAAWEALCVPAVKGVPGLGADLPVPFWAWEDVWGQWPEAQKEDLGWQAGFKFLDGLAGGREDNHVDQEEFDAAFGLAGVYLAMYIWCSSLHRTFWTGSAAWAAFSSNTGVVPGAGIPYPVWDAKVWSEYVPEEGFEKPTAKESFVYADADGNNYITEAEISQVYDSCTSTSKIFEDDLDSLPSTSSASSNTTAGGDSDSAAHSRVSLQGTWLYAGGSYSISSGQGQHSEELRAEAELGDDLHVGGDLHAQGEWLSGQLKTAEGDDFGELRVKYDTAQDAAVSQFRSPHAEAWGPEMVASRSSESSTTSVWKAAVPVPGVKEEAVTAEDGCCKEMHAACLACQSRTSVAEICAKPFLSRVEGCQTATATQKETSTKGGGDCLYVGVTYTTAVVGLSSEANVSQCQAQCAGTPGCARFSFTWSSVQRQHGSCTLSGNSEEWEPASQTVSGPPHCVALMQTHVSSVAFGRFPQGQQEDLARRLAADVAAAAGLPLSTVVDSHGRHEQVTLAAGNSFSCYLSLPPGWTMRRLSESVGGGRLRDTVLSRLAEANATSAFTSNASALNTSLVGTLLGAVPEAQCFLLHTKFLQSMFSSKGQGAHAASASTCQAICAAQPSCQHFTFWRPSGLCTLHEASAAALFDPNATAGPRSCPVLPAVQEPTDSDMSQDGEQAGPSTSGNSSVWPSAWAMLRVVLLLAALLACGVALWRSLLPRTLLRLLHIHRGPSPTEKSRGGLCLALPPHLYRPLSTDDACLTTAATAATAPPPPHLAVRSREIAVAGGGLPGQGNQGGRHVGTAGARGRTGPPKQADSSWLPRFLGPEECQSLDADRSRRESAASFGGLEWQQAGMGPQMVAPMSPVYWTNTANPTVLSMSLPPPSLRLPPPTPCMTDWEVLQSPPLIGCHSEATLHVDVNGLPYT